VTERRKETKDPEGKKKKEKRPEPIMTHEQTEESRKEEEKDLSSLSVGYVQRTLCFRGFPLWVLFEFFLFFPLFECGRE
jgi:hypothetical protein